VPLGKVTTNSACDLRMTLIKTENSIIRMLEKHEMQQLTIAQVIKQEKER
jgi:hypothetical protein